MNSTLAVKQTKFSNGEISESMRGDTSHPKYGASLRTCLNWMPIPQGALVKRPGTRFFGPVKDATYVPRPIKFFFSDNQTFVLEFGNTYLRFYQRGKYVGNDGNLHTFGDGYVGGFYELVTPFTTAMLPYLKYSQIGDVVTFSYGGQALGVAGIAPQDLRHASGALTPWTIAATPLRIPVGAVTWAGAPQDGLPPFQATGATTGPVWNKGERANSADSVTLTLDEWICIQDNVKGTNRKPPDPAALNSTGTSIQGSLDWMPAVDLAHPAIKSTWVQTAVVQDANGTTFESQPTPVLTINSSLSSDRQRPIIPRVPTLAGGYTLLLDRFYRGTAGGSFGWVNDVSPAGLSNYANCPANSIWVDDGRSPDYTRQPPQLTDPFLVNGVDSFPAVIGYLDQRRLFAASAALPSGFWLSRAGDLYNYDGAVVRLVPGSDTDAFLTVLASPVLEQIRSFLPKRRGLLLTAQGEWAVAGQNGGPVSRSGILPVQQSTWGSSWLNPISIGTGVLFNTAKSNMVRDLYPLYGLYADIWDGQELSFMARHLFDLHTLSGWDFQSTPYPFVWASRDDGQLLSLTYQHAPPSFGQQLAEGICAWAQHNTGAVSDKFEAVCVVPEPPEDAVYFIVNRLVGGVRVRYWERMNSPIPPASPYAPGVSDVRYAVYLDSSLQYDGHNDQLGLGGVGAHIDSVANPGSTNPADYAIGSQILVSVFAAPFSPFDAANPYGSAFVFDPENALGLNSLLPGGVGAVGGKIVAFNTAAQVVVELDQPMTQDQVTAWRATKFSWAIAKGQITAAHLNGYPLDSGDANFSRGVICLADGDVQVPAAWVGGVASLSTPAVVIQIGIAYNSDAALLDVYHPNQEIRNKYKNVIRVGFEVANTRDMWAGQDFSSLQQLEERTVLDAYAVMGLHTGYFEVFVPGGFGKSGSAVLRHFQPLPAIVSSVLRELALGDS